MTVATVALVGTVVTVVTVVTGVTVATVVSVMTVVTKNLFLHQKKLVLLKKKLIKEITEKITKKVKMLQPKNPKSYRTQSQNVTKQKLQMLQNSECDETRNVTKLRM